MKIETYKNIIEVCGIAKGDLVLVQYWMGEHISQDVEFLQAEIAAAGATPMLVVQKTSMNQRINENINEFTYGDKYFKLFEQADVVIDLIERPIRLIEKPLNPEQMKLLSLYMERLFKTCVSKKKMLQIRVPTPSVADSMGLEPEEFAIRMEAAMNINYKELYTKCLELKSKVEKHNKVKITTGNEQYSLELSFDNREWGIDAGDGDIPCGEISIAPLESKTNGQVFFDKITVPDGNGRNIHFTNVVLSIEKGIIIDTNIKDLSDIFQEADTCNKVICELGIGMNPNVTSLCGCALLDEKMLGTFHLGIGDNTMFGGENEADDHYDLIGVGDMTWFEFK